MKTVRPRLAALIAASTAALALSACAYFNALYNAQRLFEQARRAEAEGDYGSAFFAYGSSIDKAARSYRRSPDGRWADDALYLIGRAHFGRGDLAEARAALLRVAEQTKDARIRAGARAYLGAIEIRSGRPGPGLAYLEQALPELEDRDDRSFALIWRARGAFLVEDQATGWESLERAAAAGGVQAREARFEMVVHAIAADDTTRARSAFQSVLRDRSSARWADSLLTLADQADRRWGAEAARRLLSGAADSDWPPLNREPLVLFAAELAARAGDVDVALEEARALASSTQGRNADMARVAMARWSLARADELADIDEIRNLLLPAIGSTEARELIRKLRVLAALIDRGLNNQPVAFFAAAELARDGLGARGLARLLFTTYADVASDSDWAPKALLAAAALDPDAEEADRLRGRIRNYEESVYLAALHGRPAGQQYTILEERLARVLATIVQTAETDAERQDVAVASATAMIDSLRAAARADTVAAACAVFMDSLRITGIRADSVLAACLREERARIDTLLVIDTLLLRDTTQVQGDSLLGPILFPTDTALPSP